MIHELAELVSLVLTPTTIYLCVTAAALFFRNALLLFYSEHRQAVHWFAMGIVCSFEGSTIDNLYWGIAWSTRFVGHDSWEWWFKNGVFSNIPFRQIADSIGAYCHIRAALEYFDDVVDDAQLKKLHLHICLSIVVGLGYVGVLLWLRQ